MFFVWETLIASSLSMKWLVCITSFMWLFHFLLKKNSNLSSYTEMSTLLCGLLLLCDPSCVSSHFLRVRISYHRYYTKMFPLLCGLLMSGIPSLLLHIFWKQLMLIACIALKWLLFCMNYFFYVIPFMSLHISWYLETQTTDWCGLSSAWIISFKSDPFHVYPQWREVHTQEL